MSVLFDSPVTGFMFDTLLWTGLLIALVLVLRRPFARMFGPQIAYALWALPLVRLALPPMELPAYLAPTSGANPDMTEIAAYAEVGNAQSLLVVPEPLFDMTLLVQACLAIWLAGAAVFLLHRFSSYFRMRDDLLADARVVGRDGTIRIIETPATNAPLAFGLRQKYVALPVGFMADYDRERRDLALAHELAHHHGNDLLINFVAQPLFALHWFNPLAYLGWLALRRDQEAACDARVMALRSSKQRGAYANVIASFAAGPNVALAAPMACPVLGEKSIIHRLRSLNMTDMSTRRRWAGRGMLAAALVALPLTASISYAENAPPAPPTPPAAPSAPNSPEPSAMPDAPEVPHAEDSWLVDIESTAPDADEGEKVYVIREERIGDDGKRELRVSRYSTRTDGDHPDKEEMARIMAEVRRELAEADGEVAEAMEEHRVALAIAHHDGKTPTAISVECDDTSSKTVKRPDGEKHVVKVCSTHILASALEGLREARASLAANTELSEDIRAEVLRELDQKIKEWEKKK